LSSKSSESKIGLSLSNKIYNKKSLNELNSANSLNRSLQEVPVVFLTTTENMDKKE